MGIMAAWRPSTTISCQKAPNSAPPITELKLKIALMPVDRALETRFITGPMTSQLRGTVMTSTKTGTSIIVGDGVILQDEPQPGHTVGHVDDVFLTADGLDHVRR